MKQMLAFKCSSSKDNQEEINQQCDQIVERATGKLNLAKLNFHFLNFPKISPNSCQNCRKFNGIRESSFR